jgi:Leu/Phe-tRNA-protein transferase
MHGTGVVFINKDIDVSTILARKYVLAYQTGVFVWFTHAGNFIWHGGAR